MDLRKEKIEFFRTHIEPGIGPSPKNAIHAKEMKLTACELAMAGDTCIGYQSQPLRAKSRICAFKSHKIDALLSLQMMRSALVWKHNA